ncbi:unnamed protein product [Allacma fusca]|uniref:Uncharacterized protein n=1 Tax=Allacma fusca TaxID=39272 RepID=A0A8J2LGL5_9HEXA|nr:unnamed protein product [Allacma fusca]
MPGSTCSTTSTFISIRPKSDFYSAKFIFIFINHAFSRKASKSLIYLVLLQSWMTGFNGTHVSYGSRGIRLKSPGLPYITDYYSSKCDLIEMIPRRRGNCNKLRFNLSKHYTPRKA